MGSTFRLYGACVALAALAATNPTPAPAKTIRAGGLAALDVPGRTLEVPLRVTAEGGPRTGEVGIVIRNRRDSARRARIRYAAGSRQEAFAIVGTANTSGGERRGSLVGRRGLTVRLGGGANLRLGIEFTAGTGATPDDLHGRLLVTAEPLEAGRVPGRPLVLAIRGVRAEERNVEIVPKSVTMPVERAPVEWSWPPVIRDQRTDPGYVELRGPGAAGLEKRGTTMTATLYRDGDRESIQVPVLVKPAGDNTTSLTFRSDTTTFEDPGRYTGSLPLGPGRSAPRVGLVAEVQWWWGWAVLAVIFGVFVGRMVPPLLTKERRRRKGRDAIKDAVARFGALRRGHDRPASRDLDDLITPLHWKFRGLFVRPQDKVTRALRDLDEAAQGRELDDAVKTALQLRDDVDNWAVVERPARDLVELLERPMPVRAGDSSFEQTGAYEEANRLRLTLRRELPNSAAKTALVVEDELGLLRLSQDVWTLQDRLDRCDLPDAEEAVRRKHELRVVGRKKGSDPMQRGLEDLNALESRLRNAVACLTRLERKFAPAMGPSSPLPDPLERALKRIIWLGRRLDIAALHALIGFRRLLWGWVQGAQRRIVTRVRGWLAVAEGLSVLASLALPAVVYVLTLYTETWGTPLDFASAFAVGFAGKLAIDLGANGLSVSRTPTGDPASATEEGKAAAVGEPEKAAAVEEPEKAANGDGDRVEPPVPARLDVGPVAPTGSGREMKLLISGVPVLISWPGDEPPGEDRPSPSSPPLPPPDEPKLLG